MTVQANQGAGETARPADGVAVTIDGFEITVPKGTLIIRAAEQLGIQIPRFCDHPLLDPVGACRQCLVHVEGQPKPPASCTTTCTDGMVVHTQLTSEVAEKAQRGVMELLLVNHPLDCPMCDKGGECPLQNQAMSTGAGETRFHGAKRTFAKPIALSAQVLLDRERCVQCARCTRFAEQIAGDPLIELIDRGPQEQVGVAEGVPFDSCFSGNTVQICPVGACRQCLVHIEGQPKPPASCTTACTDGMVVHTQLTSPVAEKAQRGMMELLLVNHPLDCPMCDKGGECPLQNQAMSTGQGETRFSGVKRTFPKPIALSTEVLLDRERCIQCARCTRFAEQIAGDPLIELLDRGPQEQVGIAEGEPFDSYFSGNTVQICPVG
ncbi:MAG: 2Fe-2S iron-sulfur cluster-binding protein, partial [Streptosporangiaceae bacterium]